MKLKNNRNKVLLLLLFLLLFIVTAFTTFILTRKEVFQKNTRATLYPADTCENMGGTCISQEAYNNNPSYCDSVSEEYTCHEGSVCCVRKQEQILGCEYEGKIYPPGACFTNKDNQLVFCQTQPRDPSGGNTAREVAYEISYDYDNYCKEETGCTQNNYKPTTDYPCCNQEFSSVIGGVCQSGCTENNKYTSKAGICYPSETNPNQGVFCHSPNYSLPALQTLSLSECKKREEDAKKITKQYTPNHPEKVSCEKAGCQITDGYFYNWEEGYVANYALCKKAGETFLNTNHLAYKECNMRFTRDYLLPDPPPAPPREEDIKDCPYFPNPYSGGYYSSAPAGLCDYHSFCHAGKVMDKALGKDGDYAPNPLNPCPLGNVYCVADHYPSPDSDKYRFYGKKISCCSDQTYDKDGVKYCGPKPE